VPYGPPLEDAFPRSVAKIVVELQNHENKWLEPISPGV
jgi:hypothetical protein